MPRKKKRAVRGARATTASARAESNYPWHRRVPWIAIGGAAVVLVIGVVVRRLVDRGESPGRHRGPLAASARGRPRRSPRGGPGRRQALPAATLNPEL